MTHNCSALQKYNFILNEKRIDIINRVGPQPFIYRDKHLFQDERSRTPRYQMQSRETAE